MITTKSSWQTWSLAGKSVCVCVCHLPSFPSIQLERCSNFWVHCLGVGLYREIYRLPWCPWAWLFKFQSRAQPLLPGRCWLCKSLRPLVLLLSVSRDMVEAPVGHLPFVLPVLLPQAFRKLLLQKNWKHLHPAGIDLELPKKFPSARCLCASSICQRA